jgi:hypothetical protein
MYTGYQNAPLVSSGAFQLARSMLLDTIDSSVQYNLKAEGLDHAIVFTIQDSVSWRLDRYLRRLGVGR